ncbi:toprim domain-containing protein [Campylobacter jejuni]|uniref:toprim domain-containing protein n=1 Tax=Campylobacter jejuni TaxID=197 RepID=UPI003B9FB477
MLISMAGLKKDVVDTFARNRANKKRVFVFCTDADAAGKKFAEDMIEKYLNLETKYFPPREKKIGTHIYFR